LGILDETQLDGSVDTARHSIFKDNIREEEDRMVNGWNIRCKKRSACDDAEPNGGKVVELSALQKTLRQFRKSIGPEERLGTGTPTIANDCVRNDVVGDREEDEGVIDCVKKDGYRNV